MISIPNHSTFFCRGDFSWAFWDDSLMDKTRSTKNILFDSFLWHGTCYYPNRRFLFYIVVVVVVAEELWIPGTTRHAERRGEKDTNNNNKKRRRRKMIILLPPTLSPYKTHISNTTNNRWDFMWFYREICRLMCW